MEMRDIKQLNTSRTNASTIMVGRIVNLEWTLSVYFLQLHHQVLSIFSTNT
jgi:hypothetical protein